MSRAKGDIAETKACEYLVSLGFEIIERNFYSRFGEIDIIARKSSVIHFLEVKSAKDYETAILNITPSKINKLTKTLQVYIKKYKIKSDYSLDAVIVTPQSCDFIDSITL